MIFETERLYVTKWKPNDLAALHELYNDPAITRSILPKLTIEETRFIFENQLSLYNGQFPYGRYFIVEKLSNNFIGLLLIRNNSTIEGLEIGYSLMQDYWKKGYATEIVKKSVDWLFGCKGFSSMYAITEWHNENSKKVLLKCGFHSRKTFFEHSKMMNLFELKKEVLELH
jgi:ribosomal-protein-alanine N-acetyltransferase